MRESSVLQFFAFLVLPFISCNAQTKDNPAVAINFGRNVSNFYGPDKLKLIKEAPIVEAYHLKKDENDTTSNGLWGFKILRHIPRLSPAHVDSLKRILADSANYSFSPSGKRCGLPADLAFKFTKGGEHLVIFVALDCDVTYSTLGSTPKTNLQKDPPAKMNDIENAHPKYWALAKQLFPADYRIETPPVIRASDIGRENMYTVRKGETLKVIANNHDVDKADLLKWNKNTAKGKLKEGTILIVNDTHKVKKGESLKEIAKAYSIQESEIRAWNKLKQSTEIKVGSVLKIRSEN